MTLRLLHFSDPHIQLPRWRERSLRELGPLRALATVELWKGRGRAYDDAAEKLGQIVRDADTLAAGFQTVRVTWERLRATPATEARRLHAILSARRA